ncbi:MAG: ROK family protein [Armatimonadetes bacterium]|nr:ROK family protein [Armatimonadota bacterium]
MGVNSDFHSVIPLVVPPLDPDFRPVALANRRFLNRVRGSGLAVPLVIAVERASGARSIYETVVSSAPEDMSENLAYAERLVKMLFWQRGGWKVTVGGPPEIGDYIRRTYSVDGDRAFDAKFMSGVYERPFSVEVTDASAVPPAREESVALGKHLNGCRIGFDLGASDRKVAAVIDGEPVFSEEVVWDPRNRSDPSYHYKEIMAALKKAASHLPRVDAIGGSSAGVYINNRVMVASLFRGVPRDLFESRVRDIFINMRKDWGGIPFQVVNDGEVTALAGAMSLGDNAVLGIALGSSEAGGYVTPEGNITGWLNELAFAPVDVSPSAPVDEWSGDRGVGALYFSQQAVFRLAPTAGIMIDEDAPPAERLKSVQEMLASGDERARRIWDTIGVYLGYGIAHYADFYNLRHVLILGRVTSGLGGNILVERACEVLVKEFPELMNKVELHLPDESSRRVGQAVAAASLPE